MARASSLVTNYSWASGPLFHFKTLHAVSLAIAQLVAKLWCQFVTGV